MGGEGEYEISLEFTPTWVVACIFAVLAIFSFTVKNISLFFRKLFDRSMDKNRILTWDNNNNNQGGNIFVDNQLDGEGVAVVVEEGNDNINQDGDDQPHPVRVIIKAYSKILEELAVVGLMFPILLFSENIITQKCIPRCVFDYMLPCSLADRLKAERQADAQPTPTFCSRKGMVPLLSLKALHDIELFLLILLVLHIIFSLVTVGLGILRINRLEIYADGKLEGAYTTAMRDNWQDFEAKRNGDLFRLKVFGQSILRSILGSVTESDYLILKYGFCVYKGNLLELANRDCFRRPMISANIDYFKQIGGVSFYLWVFAIIFLLLNVQGWHGYFWIAIIPILPLILVGAILENIVTQLAIEISEVYVRHDAREFLRQNAKTCWFNNCPDFILYLIQFIIFQTAFQIATFVWTGARYGLGSCMMGQLYYTLSRLFFGVCTLGVCGYCTLPLYTIVTQVGNKSSWETILGILSHPRLGGGAHLE